MEKFKILIYFRQLHVEFRLPELKAALEILKIEAEYDESTYTNNTPFFIIYLSSLEDAMKICNRCLLIRGMYLILADGKTHEETRLEFLKTETQNTFQSYNCDNEQTWKFTVERFNNTSLSKTELFNFYFEGICLYGKVNLKSPARTFSVLENWIISPTQTPNLKSTSIRILEHTYLCILIAEGDDSAVKKYDLKKRAYLGTTSMDARLSLIMSTQALLCQGKLAYDPFVGTGSFLCTSAAFGAFSMGSDIDGRQIRGLTKHLNKGVGVSANIKQYGLSPFVLDTVVCDHSRHPFRNVALFDAIVTDPPYGVRAGAKKIKADTEKRSLEESRFPETIAYDMEEVVIDLVNFSAVHLKVGGRLVFWLPTVTQEYSVQDLPSHPMFKLIADSSQSFGSWERRLITLEKIISSAEMVESALNIPEDANADSSGYIKPAHAHFRMKYFSAFGK